MKLSKETKRRTINYKLVKLGNHPLSLQKMLESTLLNIKSDFHLASNRRESLTEDGNSFRFINRYTQHDNDMLLCQIVQFEQGRSQMTIVIDKKANMFEVNPISTKDMKSKKGESTEFLESMAYFGIMGNHMVVMGSQALKSRELERHLNWYLNSLTKQMDGAVILSDRPTAKAMKQLEKGSAKSVSIGSEIKYTQGITEEPSSVRVESFEENVTEAKSVKWSPVGLGASILECLRDNGYIGKFDLNETLDDANLQVSIEFKYNRKTTKSGQRVIDTLSSSLRHLDKEDVKINLKGGGEIKGDDLKLSHEISIGCYDGKVDEADLYYKMKDWLGQKIKSKEVVPDLQDLVDEQ